MAMRTMKTPVRTAATVRAAPSSTHGRLPGDTRWSEAAIADALSFLFPFTIILLVLFNQQISPIGPAVQIVTTLAATLFLMRTRPHLLAHSWMIAIGLICLSSAFWSVVPALSARAGIQVTITLLTGVVIGLLPRQDRVATAIFGGFLIYVTASLIFGKAVALGNNGALAFSGLTTSKNYFAATIVFLMIAAVAMLVMHKRLRLVTVIAVLFAVLIGAVALARARSATAIIASVAGIAVFGLAWIALRLPTQKRLLIMAAGILTLAPLALVTDDIETVVVGGTLSAFDKDAGLTGRDALWASAARIVDTKPLLGRGYYTFWVQGNPTAERLWFQNHIASRAGFNFHNVRWETLVGIGWGGYGVMMLVVVFGTTLLLSLAIFRPSVTTAFWLAIAATILLRFGTEAIFPVPFGIETVLLSAALTYAWRQFHVRQGMAAPVRGSRRTPYF